MSEPPLDEARRSLEEALRGVDAPPPARRRGEPPPTGPSRDPGFWRGARRPGAVCLALGVAMVGLNVHMMRTSGLFFPKGLAVGVVTLGFGGLAMGFPGTVELPAFSASPPPPQVFWAGLGGEERFAWALGMGGTMLLALGLALGL